MTCPHITHFIHTHSGHSPSFCILSEWPLLSIPPSKLHLCCGPNIHIGSSLSYNNLPGLTLHLEAFQCGAHFSSQLYAFHGASWTENAQQRFIVLTRLRGNPVVFMILFSANSNEGKLERGMTTRLSFLPSLYLTFKGEDGWVTLTLSHLCLNNEHL